jgi:hypothetical protein
MKRYAPALSRPLAALALALSATGCDNDTALGNASIDGLNVLPKPDMSSIPADAAPPVDAAPPPPDLAPPPPLDMDTPAPDATPPDMGGLIDGGVPMGDPCDPRLRSVACPQGAVCAPIPGGQVYQGRCVQGDACDLLTSAPCAGDTPQCQLAGLSTVCGAPAPARTLGQPCRDEFNRPLPCAEGLICNFSVCTPPCDPADPAAACAVGQRCVDLSAPLGQPAGYCGSYGACDPASDEGCAPDQLCSFGVRPDDLRVVSFCSPAGPRGLGEACRDGGALEESCGRGLICLGPSVGAETCRSLCDPGAYLSPCPPNQACTGRIVLGGVPVDSVGFCVTNP